MSILEDFTLSTHLQPVVSLKRKDCVGALALTRARHRRSGEHEAPRQLFQKAQEAGISVDLDRQCRRQALESFARLRAPDQDLLLFLRFRASIIDEKVLGSGVLVKTVREYGLDPHHIVIELDDSPVKDLVRLLAFVKRHRELGFLIAIDDMDGESSNLQRLALIRPDIIKLSTSMARGLDKNLVQREVFRSLTGLARRVGALVMADGLENEVQAVAAMELGADFFKGYHFARPAEPAQWRTHHLETIIQGCLRTRKLNILRVNMRRAGQASKQSYVLGKVAGQLSQAQPADFDGILSSLLARNPLVECLYVLDRTGRQVSNTILSSLVIRGSRNALFKPALPGTDHSSKDYFTALSDMRLERNITEPYVSLATGSLTRTFSLLIKCGDGAQYILCMDVEESEG